MNLKIFRNARIIIPYLFPALVFAAAAIYIGNNLEQFRQVEITSWWWLAALFGSCLGQSFTSALVFQKLLRIFRVRLGFWESVGLVFVTGVGNFLVPYVGGIGLRGAYLKKRHGFSLGYFASTVGGAALLTFGINALIGLGTAGYLFLDRGIFSPAITGVFVCCLLLPAVFIFLPAREIRSGNRLLRKIGRVWEGWGMISRRSSDVAVLSSYIFLTAIFGILILYCSFRAVSEAIAFSDAVIVSAMTALSALVNITPSGLGVSELVIVFTSRALGYLAVIGVSAALIRRAVSAVILFAGGGISSFLLPRAAVRVSGSAGGEAGPGDDQSRG